MFTGLSGSGKSSLAFDTIFAEGQRRYVESLSAYARQFLGQMDKPDVDFIEGLSPAVSIDQKSTNRNPRSTVGTITEVYDYLRLLYARAGVPHCPVCGHVIERQTPQQIVDQVLAMEEGSRFQVLAPVVRTRKGEFVDLFSTLQAQGYSRVLVDGTVHQLTDPPTLKKQEKHDISVVVDRLAVKGSAKQRLTDSVETALRLADGLVVLDFVDLDDDDPHRERRFSERMACPNGHPLTPRRPRAAHLLLQLALRRLPRVQRHRDQEGGRPGAGGARPGGQPGRRGHRAVGGRAVRGVLRPAAGGAGQPASASGWTPRGASCRPPRRRRCCTAATSRCTSATATGTAASARTTPTSRASSRSWSAGWTQTDSDYAREKYEGYMRDVPCPVCKGARLKPEVLAVTLTHRDQGERSIAEVSAMSVAECSQFLDGMLLDARQADDRRAGAQGGAGPAGLPARRRAALPVAGPGGRARCPAARRSASGWPRRSGPGWSGVLYVLDEPSIGLHQRDNRRLIQTLVRLRDLGNTLIVVEHDEDTIRAADWAVDIGPGAGEHGGEIVHSGTGRRRWSRTTPR